MGLFYLFFVSSCRSLGVMPPHTSSREEYCGAVGMDIGGKVLSLSLDFNIWIG